MATAQIDAALDLVKRLPPDNIVNNLSSLVELAPSLTEELLSRIDQPLQVREFPALALPASAFYFVIHCVHAVLTPRPPCRWLLTPRRTRSSSSATITETLTRIGETSYSPVLKAT